MQEKQHEPRFIKPKADTGPTRVLYVAGVGHQFGTSAEAVRQVFAEFGGLDESIENGVDMVPDKVRRNSGYLKFAAIQRLIMTFLFVVCRRALVRSGFALWCSRMSPMRSVRWRRSTTNMCQH
jgi:hypothetical protein